jgi:hypothetical protein
MANFLESYALSIAGGFDGSFIVSLSSGIPA